MRLLFIGEAPPASGRFFYHRDSGLYRAIRDAFQTVHPSLNDDNFLAAFEAMGCRLIDLCPEPVDRLEPYARRNACRAAEPALAETIASLKPAAIATMLRSIEANVARAATHAAWQGTFIHLPYPGRWVRHRDAFIEQLVPVITSSLPTLSAEG